MTKHATIYKFDLNTTTVQDLDLFLIGREIYDVVWDENSVTILVQDI